MDIAIELTHNDGALVEYYFEHWLDMGVNRDDVDPNWRNTALAFIADARRTRRFAGFLALLDGKPIGAACCQLIDRVYPSFLVSDAATIGYLWGVYVVPVMRSRGVGAGLVRSCIQHLAMEGCGRVLLHAGVRPTLYERIGFRFTYEMTADLPKLC